MASVSKKDFPSFFFLLLRGKGASVSMKRREGRKRSLTLTGLSPLPVLVRVRQIMVFIGYYEVGELHS